MDWSIILGSVSGGVLGGVGSLITKCLSMVEARQNHKMEMERLDLASRIDLQKADLNLRQTREEQTGAAFTAAIQADAAATADSGWARDLRAVWRPALTVALVTVATVQSFFAGESTQDFIFLTLTNLAAQSVSFWFGVRTFEKLTITPVSRPVAGGKK